MILDSVFSLGCLFSHKWQLPWFSKIFYHAYLKNKKSTKNGYLWKLSAIESGKRKKDKWLRLPDPYLDIFAFSMTSRMMGAGVMSLSGCPIHFYFYCPRLDWACWSCLCVFSAVVFILIRLNCWFSKLSRGSPPNTATEICCTLTVLQIHFTFIWESNLSKLVNFKKKYNRPQRKSPLMIW